MPKARQQTWRIEPRTLHLVFKHLLLLSTIPESALKEVHGCRMKCNVFFMLLSHCHVKALDTLVARQTASPWNSNKNPFCSRSYSFIWSSWDPPVVTSDQKDSLIGGLYPWPLLVTMQLKAHVGAGKIRGTWLKKVGAGVTILEKCSSICLLAVE